MAHLFVVASGFCDAAGKFNAQLWGRRPLSEVVLAADELACLLEDAPAPAATRRSKARPTPGLAVRVLVLSDPPQIVPTTSSDTSIGARSTSAIASRPVLTSSRPAAPRCAECRPPSG